MKFSYLKLIAGIILFICVSETIHASDEHPPGKATFIDLSVDVLLSVGGSSADDEALQLLQGGGHDPNISGFNLQSVEFSLMGAVDHYFAGEAHLLFGVDNRSGSSFMEIEEIFFRTLSMPGGLALKGGIFLTEIGRANPFHVHAWRWQDQPIINSRILGPDGMRGIGIQGSWLIPAAWYSELYFSAQNAIGQTMISFLGDQDTTPGNQAWVDRDVNGLTDLAFALRWANGFDFSDTLSSKIGVSFITGPNAAGQDTFTQIFGADYVLKWVPLNAKRGWPYLTWETEVLLRNYYVDPSFTNFNDANFINIGLSTSAGVLNDWGGYTQMLYGFRPRWSAGIRFEYATGNEAAIGTREFDPFRDDRIRISPLLSFSPSEFSRLRLQYNFDNATHLETLYAHSFWLGIEFLFGAHPAHDF